MTDASRGKGLTINVWEDSFAVGTSRSRGTKTPTRVETGKGSQPVAVSQEK
jgi:hypothetical protein